jgi:polar amino acid transport system substrate-binding protein
MKITRIGSIFTAVLVALLDGCAVTPATPTPTAKSELAPTGVLRVAVFTGNPVIGSLDKSGQPAGTTVILGTELAQRAGVPVKIIGYPAIAKMVEDAKANVWDIAVVAYDPARRGILDFVPAHMVVDLTYLVAPGSSIRSVADVDKPGVKVAAARGAATTLYLERTLKQAVVTPADNEPAAFDLLREGKAQALAQNRYMLLGLAERLPGARVVEDRFSAADMSIVLPKGRPAALAYVGEFVEQAKTDGTIARAIDAAALRGVTVAPAAK